MECGGRRLPPEKWQEMCMQLHLLCPMCKKLAELHAPEHYGDVYRAVKNADSLFIEVVGCVFCGKTHDKVECRKKSEENSYWELEAKCPNTGKNFSTIRLSKLLDT